MNFISTDQLQLAFDFVNFTDKHLFLTGKAGTGKTTFLHQLRLKTAKRMVIVAPTGVAAINAGGVTIHSFFQLPFGPQIPEEFAADIARSGRFQLSANNDKSTASRYQKMTREKINIIKSLDLLVIDEISMVRADLLDAIDSVLRRYRYRSLPFGGVQLLMIGDVQQLAPVAKEEEWEMLRPYYDSVYFYSSLALKKTDYISLELTEVFRQQDEKFIAMLNKVRENELDDAAIIELNKRYLPGFDPADDEGYITLTTHNYQSQKINDAKLETLKGKPKRFEATVTGDFPEYAYPTDYELMLKTGAQVMFVKNDPNPAKAFYNGKIGTLVQISDKLLKVQCKGDEEEIEVMPLEWNNCRYTLNEETKEIKETVIGSFTQYPLKLAWAITIHKSQGLTFEKAIIDANASFTHGQVYVALSRCKTLEGMVLSTPILRRSIRHDAGVNHFVHQIQENPPDTQRLEDAKIGYQQSLLHELFDFEPQLKRMFTLSRIVSENIGAVDASAQALMDALIRKYKIEVVEVGEKFRRQIAQFTSQQTDVEQNEALQERIRKAVGYFNPKMAETIQLAQIDFVTDNTAVRKSLNDTQERMLSVLYIRQQCLLVSKNGFSVSAYVETRAKSALEMPVMKKKEIKESFGNQKNLSLYRLLKKWRDNLAEEMDVRPDLILPWKALNGISEELPVNLIELKRINGIGKKKLAAYGGIILEMISDYNNRNNLGLTIDASEQPAEQKPQKADTKQVSFDLYKAGKTLEEIATERNFAVTTIIGHLAAFVKSGHLSVDEFLTKDKIDLITEYFTETRDLSLGSAKHVLGDDVSYGDIKLVLSHLEHLGKIDESYN
ncbi:MAG: AAA family ATPase [Bacteroidales bacterium]|nr:AAA family ATPase [Bacteroidales bacterium]